MLRDRLIGLAKSEWKDDLTSDVMRSKLTSKEGVDHFMTFCKGKTFREPQHVYYWRMFQLLRLRRGRMDFKPWIIKYRKVRDRLSDAYMDLLPDYFKTDAGLKAREKYDKAVAEHEAQRLSKEQALAQNRENRAHAVKSLLEEWERAHPAPTLDQFG